MSDVIISSALAQLCSQVVIWPSEVLKLKKQIHPNKSIRQLAVHTYRNHGLWGLCTTGFAPAAAANIPRIISHFYFYDILKRQWQWHHIPSSFASGCAAALVSTPLYNMTTRKVYGMTKSYDMSFRYAYNGFRALLFKNCLEVCTTFYLYDFLYKQKISGLWLGGFASAASCLVTNPVDAINTTLQTDYDKKHRNRMTSAFRFILSNYGIRGLYAGCGTRMIRAFPGGAVRYYVFVKTMDKISARC